VEELWGVVGWGGAGGRAVVAMQQERKAEALARSTVSARHDKSVNGSWEYRIVATELTSKPTNIHL
jgi:hypothetical protein